MHMGYHLVNVSVNRAIFVSFCLISEKLNKYDTEGRGNSKRKVLNQNEISKVQTHQTNG